MNFTEELARKKWCPMSKPGESISNCLGSNCMWWQWVEYYDPETNIRTFDEFGYCGAVRREQ